EGDQQGPPGQRADRARRRCRRRPGFEPVDAARQHAVIVLWFRRDRPRPDAEEVTRAARLQAFAPLIPSGAFFVRALTSKPKVERVDPNALGPPAPNRRVGVNALHLGPTSSANPNCAAPRNPHALAPCRSSFRRRKSTPSRNRRSAAA